MSLIVDVMACFYVLEIKNALTLLIVFAVQSFHKQTLTECLNKIQVKGKDFFLNACLLIDLSRTS